MRGYRFIQKWYLGNILKMKLIVLIAAVSVVVCYQPDFEEEEKQYHIDMATMFKQHLVPLNTRVALEANYYTKGHFIISAHSIWYNLATSAEAFAEGEKKEFLSLLNLPDDQPLRQQFYSRALQLEGLGESVNFSKSQAIAVDETVEIKKEWHIFSDLPFGMPEYLPSVTFAKPFGKVQKYIARDQLDIPYSSHTVLLDHLMFEGLWGSAFSDRTVQQGPFYNEHKEQIATVEYLRIKGRLRVAHSSDNSFKVLEVPVGLEGHHTVLLAVGDKVETMIEAVSTGDILLDLKLTEEPIQVAIPRMSMSSGLDMGLIFRNMKRSKVFVDPAATSSESDTPASPMGYFQIVTVNITDSVGRDDSKLKELANEEIDFAELEKDGFLVNRPYVFALLVPFQYTDITVPVFTGVCSYPGERGHQKIFD